MPIQFQCPHCQQLFNVDDSYGGTTGNCAKCGQPFTVPAATGQAPTQPPPSNPYADPVATPQQGFGQQGFPQQAFPPHATEESAAMRMLVPVGRSPWAIAAGYTGLFAVLLVPAPFALLLGIVAVRDIRKNSKLHGMGRAVFAIVMGLLGTIGLGWLIIAMSMGL